MIINNNEYYVSWNEEANQQFREKMENIEHEGEEAVEDLVKRVHECMTRWKRSRYRKERHQDTWCSKECSKKRRKIRNILQEIKN